MAQLEDIFGMPIRDLIPKIVAEHSTDVAAIRFMAAKLETTLDPSIVSVWAKRLNIVDEVKVARQRRDI